MSDFDFVFLTETFSVNFPSQLFPMHDVFLSPGIRLSDATTARLSGGVALLIKKDRKNSCKTDSCGTGQLCCS